MTPSRPSRAPSDDLQVRERRAQVGDDLVVAQERRALHRLDALRLAAEEIRRRRGVARANEAMHRVLHLRVDARRVVRDDQGRMRAGRIGRADVDAHERMIGLRGFPAYAHGVFRGVLGELLNSSTPRPLTRTMSAPAAPGLPRALDARLMTLLAITMFAAAGSIHFQTAMLGAIAQEFGADTARSAGSRP